jgi:CRP/FNR family transcriptional regulator, cyclic AMP receptor protein
MLVALVTPVGRGWGVQVTRWRGGERLTAAEVEAWKALGQLRRYADGEALMREGERAKRALLLTSGRVRVITAAEDGPEVVLAYREAGEIFGEMSVLDDRPHSATVQALGPVEAWSVSPGQFMTYLEGNPKVAVSLLLVMARRLREADDQRLRYRARSVIERIAERLLYLADRCGEATGTGVRLGMRLTGADLAATVAAARESEVKAVKRLKEMGAIETDAQHHFVITDRETLRRVADGDVPGVGE